MVVPEDLATLVVAAGSAAAVGLLAGFWIALPPEIARPAVAAAPELLSTIDPNLAAYRAMLAREGVSPAPPATAAVYTPPKEGGPPDEGRYAVYDDRDAYEEGPGPDGFAAEGYATSEDYAASEAYAYEQERAERQRRRQEAWAERAAWRAARRQAWPPAVVYRQDGYPPPTWGYGQPPPEAAYAPAYGGGWVRVR